MSVCFPLQCFAQAEEYIDTLENKDIVLYQGDIVALRVYSLTRIAISKPGIVQIINADVDELLLSGAALGQTQIFIWDEYGKRSLLARVMEQDLDMVKERIQQLLDAGEIEGITLEHSAYEGKLIATGKVNKVQKEDFDEIIKEFSEFVINMVDEQGDLIQIDAQVTELDTTLSKAMGVSWSQPPITLTEDAAPGADKSGFSDVFRIGDFARTATITATINALLAETKARDLAKPSLIVSDGQSASINIGGEVPIATSVTSDGAVSENVSYKTYGVNLSITPEIMDDDKIDININISISDQDSDFTGEGTAFTTTSVNTQG
jgi:Flp pilus assembly secretin CpaC